MVVAVHFLGKCMMVGCLEPCRVRNSQMKVQVFELKG